MSPVPCHLLHFIAFVIVLLPGSRGFHYMSRFSYSTCWGIEPHGKTVALVVIHNGEADRRGEVL